VKLVLTIAIFIKFFHIEKSAIKYSLFEWTLVLEGISTSPLRSPSRRLNMGSFKLYESKSLNSKTLNAPKASADFIKQMQGFGLATAEILYHIPDHPHVLQTFIWQQYDLAPLFPDLKRFLAFWHEKLDGPLHSVRVAHERLIKPSEFKLVDGYFALN
jgi:uncharacterized protein Usg